MRNNLIIREWVNGTLLPLNISLVLATGLFLWTEFCQSIDPWIGRKTWSTFQARDGVATACALFWIFLADGLRAGAAWSVLNSTLPIAGLPPAAIDPMSMPFIQVVNIMFIVAGIVGVLAALRCIHLFTPPAWGHWYWLGAVALTALFHLAT